MNVKADFALSAIRCAIVVTLLGVGSGCEVENTLPGSPPRELAETPNPEAAEKEARERIVKALAEREAKRRAEEFAAEKEARERAAKSLAQREAKRRAEWNAAHRAWRTIRLGMTDKEVAAMLQGWGRRVNRTVRSGGTDEQWVYMPFGPNRIDDYKYLYFENGILIAYQE